MKYKESLENLLKEHRSKFILEFTKLLQENDVDMKLEDWTYEEFNMLMNTYNYGGINNAANYLKNRKEQK